MLQIPSLKILLLGLCLIILSCEAEKNSTNNTNSKMFTKMDITPPKAEKKPKELVKHEDKRIDNYYWLNERENPEVISYLEAENEYTDQLMAHTKDFQQTLFDEIKGRIKETDMSVPYKSNGYWYATRYEEGMEYPIYTRKKGSLDAEEEITLNVNDLAKDFDFYTVGGMNVSPDNKILAYGEDTLSRRIYTIRFKNLETNKVIEDHIPNTTGRVVWANDNKTVFYSVKDETLRSYKIFKHKLGTDASTDQEVYHEKDATFNTFVTKTKSKKYILIGSSQTLSTEYRYISADTPDAPFKIIQERQRDLEYGVSHYGDHWYIMNNKDAKNFKLSKCEVGQDNEEYWEDIIEHRDDVLLEGIDIFENHLVLSERKAGITQIRVKTWDQSSDYYVDFGEDAYLAYTTTNLDFDTPILRMAYTSLTTPSSVYDFDMNTKSKELLKQQEVVGDFNAEDYTSERIFVEARDGAKVPVSIVYKKGTAIDGTAPLLLYAYGSYGYSMDPYFSSSRLSLLDRGFVYAIAHIRGGQEMGRSWYEDGKLLHKKNTFNDFVDCGKYMIEKGYANEDKLFAMGGSAGGLLMGAVVNQAPELWKGVIAAVPFVDVITTMLDESIPLTTGEYDEWGNPNNKEYYDYIKSYSPYDNVEAKSYPSLLVTTGLHDSQVQYFEPAKWVAKLRELKTDQNPLLLHTNMEAGHSGNSGRFQQIKETALEYAFLLDLADKSGL